MVYIFPLALALGLLAKILQAEQKNALLCILQQLYMLNNNSLEVYLKFYDAQVQPIAQYGAELWGLDWKRSSICFRRDS